MAETKYGKYIVRDFNKHENLNAWAPKYRPEDKIPLLFMDGSVIKNAFYSECCWFLPAMMGNKSLSLNVKPHKHTYNEVLALIGSNPDEPRNLNGELEIFLNGERHLIMESVMIFLPAGLEHGPIRWLRLDRPVFHFGCGMTEKQA
jgi:hypothetical protein